MRRRITSRLTRPLDARLERLHQEIGYAKQMAARAYEAVQRWPEQLAEIRAEPGYEAAYTEPEPLVTVRIATYNRAELLCERALASVRAQSYERWEAVVVGDHCSDDTAERVAALGDERIRFINLPYRQPYPQDARARWHVGGLNAMNGGLRAAKGRWIATLDDDDEFTPEHISTLLAVAQAERAEIAYGQLQVVDADTHEPLDLNISRWPPVNGGFNFLSSIAHAGLRRFEFDPNCLFAGEVLDWNLARRLWDAGVRFTHTESIVGTYYLRPRPWH
jgi:glycosyltransferase involved in cell wall biosynthesis